MKSIILMVVGILMVVSGFGQMYFDDLEKESFPIITARDHTIISANSKIDNEKSTAKIGLFGSAFTRKIFTYQSSVPVEVPTERFLNFKGEEIGFLKTTQQTPGRKTANKSGFSNQNLIRIGEHSLISGATVSGVLNDNIAKLFAEGKANPGVNARGYIGYMYNLYRPGTPLPVKKARTYFVCCKNGGDTSIVIQDTVQVLETKPRQSFTILGYVGGGYSYNEFRIASTQDLLAFVELPKATGVHSGNISLNLLAINYIRERELVNPFVLLYGATLNIERRTNYKKLPEFDVLEYTSITSSIDSTNADTLRQIQTVFKDGSKYSVCELKKYWSTDLTAFVTFIPKFGVQSRLGIVLYGRLRNDFTTYGYTAEGQTVPQTLDKKPELDLGIQFQLLESKNILAPIVGIYFEGRNIGKANFKDEATNSSYKPFVIGITSSWNIFQSKLKS